MNKIFSLLLIASVFLSFKGSEPDPDEAGSFARYIRKHYTKQEHYIPMRDGVRLFTSVYLPKDKPAACPILLNRTPYSVGPYGKEMKSFIGPSEKLTRDGYIIVYQDVRGRFMSEGEFDDMRPMLADTSGMAGIDESTDTWDTVEWLVKNIPGNNGKVGVWGISYPGFYAAAATVRAHPAVKAVSPQAPIADWFFDDFHHHGAFFLPHSFNFIAVFGQPRPFPTTEWPEGFEHGTKNGYRFFLKRVGALSNVNPRFFHGNIAFWDSLSAHPNYDTYWKKRNLLPHLKNTRPAVLVVGGWFDAEDLYGPLHIYQAIEKSSPDAENKLVMGPWSHGGWSRGNGSFLGDVWFTDDPPPSGFFREEIEYPFFTRHLKGTPSTELPGAMVFETGKNIWRSMEKWPPANVQPVNWYLHTDGSLGADSTTGSTNPFTGFVSDPADPVPYTAITTTGMTPAYMTEDQSFASERKDVLVFQTPPLKDDITLAGSIQAELYVSTDREDADWVVKLIDVYPGNHPAAPHQAGKNLDGYMQMVRSEVFRGRFRNSYSVPQPFRPGKVEKLSFPLQDVFHTFRKGHRVMVQVQSTWFPLVDRNPQQWVENIFKAEDGDFLPAEHRLYNRAGARSCLLMPVLVNQPDN